MLKQIARTLRPIVRRLGADLTYYSMPSLIRHADPDVVLDVGANAGQYGRQLRAFGYTGRIVSFEPLEQAHRDLSAAAYGDSAWVVAPRMALGDKPGEATINVAANSYSSSLLPMCAAHLAAAPHSAYVGEERVQVRTLDEVFPDYAGQRPLLKIDVQGYESQVLAGAAKALERIHAIQVELSLVELYRGEAALFDVLSGLRSRGFMLFSMTPAFTDERTGQLLQADCFLLKS